MTNHLVGQLYSPQCDTSERRQQSFRSRTSCPSFGIAGVQFRQCFSCAWQASAHHMFHHRQHTQGQTEQARHTFGMVFASNMQGTSALGTPLQTSEVSLNERGLTVDPDYSGQRKLFLRRVRGMQALAYQAASVGDGQSIAFHLNHVAHPFFGTCGTITVAPNRLSPDSSTILGFKQPSTRCFFRVAWTAACRGSRSSHCRSPRPRDGVALDR